MLASFFPCRSPKVIFEGLKPDSSAGGGGKGLADDALGPFMPCHMPWLPLKADLGLPEEVCLAAVGSMGLAFTSQGAQLQDGGDLEVGEVQRGLEWYRGEPDPAQLGGCLDDGLGLLRGWLASPAAPPCSRRRSPGSVGVGW
jgi:hypothetical protein